MLRRPSAVAALSAALLLVPGAGAQNAPATQAPSPLETPRLTNGGGFLQRYKPRELPPVNLANTNRMDALMRGGIIYLSLQDAIALSLENNLDIEVQRYGPLLADANVLRAQAGGFAREVLPPASRVDLPARPANRLPARRPGFRAVPPPRRVAFRAPAAPC